MQVTLLTVLFAVVAHFDGSEFIEVYGPVINTTRDDGLGASGGPGQRFTFREFADQILLHCINVRASCYRLLFRICLIWGGFAIGCSANGSYTFDIAFYSFNMQYQRCSI